MLFECCLNAKMMLNQCSNYIIAMLLATCYFGNMLLQCYRQHVIVETCYYNVIGNMLSQWYWQHAIRMLCGWYLSAKQVLNQCSGDAMTMLLATWYVETCYYNAIGKMLFWKHDITMISATCCVGNMLIQCYWQHAIWMLFECSKDAIWKHVMLMLH